MECCPVAVIDDIADLIYVKRSEQDDKVNVYRYDPLCNKNVELGTLSVSFVRILYGQEKTELKSCLNKYNTEVYRDSISDNSRLIGAYVLWAHIRRKYESEFQRLIIGRAYNYAAQTWHRLVCEAYFEIMKRFQQSNTIYFNYWKVLVDIVVNDIESTYPEIPERLIEQLKKSLYELGDKLTWKIT